MHTPPGKSRPASQADKPYRGEEEKPERTASTEGSTAGRATQASTSKGHASRYFENMTLDGRKKFVEHYHPRHGHSRIWWENHNWAMGPSYEHPTYECWVGGFWFVMPAYHVLVWVYVEEDDRYYPAYYYPEYGYYAWVDEPLIAAGVYDEHYSIVLVK